MRTMISTVAIVGALFLIDFSIAKAEDWVRVSRADENKVEAYVDVDSISNDDGRKKFWMYHDMKGKVKSRDGKPIERAYGHAIVDCEAKTIGYMETIIHWPDGSKSKNKEKLEMEPVRTDSVNAAVLKFVCEKE